MAINTLNTIFGLEMQIEKLEAELKILKIEEKKLIEQAIKSGSTENRYYKLESKTRKGDRVIDIVLLQEKYPTVYEKCRIESVKVTDVQKLLGDTVIDEISERKPDTITYYVEKKKSSPVVVA